MLPETSMSAWIPALHAGMTQPRALPKMTAVALLPFLGAHEDTDYKLKPFELSVSFARFMVRR